MVLVDTSIWVRSMHVSGADLAKVMKDLLRRDEALAHDFVHGELMLGQGGRTRQGIVENYTKLRHVDTLKHDAVVSFIKKHKIENRGIGYLDAHLLAAASSAEARLWTVDKALRAVADELDLLFDPAKEAS